MSFVPRFCPRPRCVYNKLPAAGFACRHGRFYSRALGRFIPRFRCSGCSRTFSWSTFRFTYRQKKPHLDAALMTLLCSGVSLRAAGRLLDINQKTVARKFRRLGRHSRSLHRAVLDDARIAGSFQLDELETFESNRFQPVTVPVLIEKTSYFVLATAAAPIRRKGRMTMKQQKMRDRHEALHGPRPTRSDAAVRDCLDRLRRCTSGEIVLESDRKTSYARLGRQRLGRRLRHRVHSSRTRRDRANPLFPINHTNAMLRYCLARLRRRTWCVSRHREWLQLALDLYTGWFNYCRGITIRTHRSPAQALGLSDRKLSPAEWLSWRQDWPNAGRYLPRPLAPVPQEPHP